MNRPTAMVGNAFSVAIGPIVNRFLSAGNRISFGATDSLSQTLSPMLRLVGNRNDRNANDDDDDDYCINAQILMRKNIFSRCLTRALPGYPEIVQGCIRLGPNRRMRKMIVMGNGIICK